MVLQLSHELLRKNYRYDTDEEATVLLKVTAPEKEELQDADGSNDDSESRLPLDLVVVLDVSGSMSGSKLKLCKETCKLLSQQLVSKDRMGMVTFGSDASVRQNLTTMDSAGKEATRIMIDQINVGGMTNLSGGLFKGIQTLARGYRNSSADGWDGDFNDSDDTFMDDSFQYQQQQMPKPLNLKKKNKIRSQNRSQKAGAWYSNIFRGSTAQAVATDNALPVATAVSVPEVPVSRGSTTVPMAEPLGNLSNQANTPLVQPEAKIEANTGKSPTRLQAILLLTDGQANRGIDQTNPLLSRTNQLLKRWAPSARIFTFGYGADHNSDMLQALASEGSEAGGSYFFVEDVEDVKGAFADCFGGLSSVTAQNVALTVRAVAGAKVSAPLTSFSFKPLVEQNGFCITIPDLYEGETKNILLKVQLPKLAAPVPTPVGLAFETAATAILSAELQYADCQLDSEQRCGPVVIHVARPQSLTQDQQDEMNEEVSSQLLRITAAQQLKNARSFAESGNLSSGQEALRSIKENLRVARSRPGSEQNQVLASLEQDISEAIESMSSVNCYRSKGKHQMMSKACEYDRERNTSSKASAYRTKKQAKTRSTFLG